MGAALQIDVNAPLQGATMGQRIQAARLRAGLNKTQFGKLVDVSAPTIDAWEADKKEIRLSNLERVAEVTGFSVEELRGAEARVVRDDETPAALLEFAEQRKAQGRPISDERLATLSGYRWKGGAPTAQTFAFFDAALDSMLPEDVARAQAEKTASATASALARGARPLVKKR